MRYVDYVYEIISDKCKGFDSVYEDYIVELVGTAGLHELIIYNFLETCGVVNGRQLYVIYK